MAEILLKYVYRSKTTDNFISGTKTIIRSTDFNPKSQILTERKLPVHMHKAHIQGGMREYEEQLLVREELREALGKERGRVSDEDGVGRVQNCSVE
jgi:hypothetical protein